MAILEHIDKEGKLIGTHMQEIIMEIRLIEFDTDGITDQCPEEMIKTYGECEQCLWFIKSICFTVYCSWMDANDEN